MAAYLVLEDFGGTPALSAGELIDDESFDVAELSRSGVALLAYLDVTMADALEAFRGLPPSRRPRGELLALLVAAGAVGGGGSGSGDVIGPASATADAIARFNGATGKVLKNSLVTITDAGSIAVPVGQTVDGRDVSVDGAKLDTIASGAQANTVASVFGRGGAVVAAADDYTHAQLASIQGGTVGERFHVTAAEGADVTAVRAVANDRLVYRDPGGSIVGLDPASIGGGADVLDALSGFRAGATAADRDFYLAGSDLLNVPTFTLAALVRVRSRLPFQTIAGSWSEFGGDGHALFVENSILRFVALASDGTPVAVDAFIPERLYGRWMLVTASKTTFGADWVATLRINGGQISEAYEESGGGARATHELAIGASFNGEGRAAENVEIGFVGLALRTISEAESAEWFSRILDDATHFVDAPSGLDHAWLASAAGGATWAAQIGAADLARVGTADTLAVNQRTLRI